MAKRRKQDVFSVTKAVKANARERVGTPRPALALPDEKSKAEHRAAKHKPSLQSLIEQKD